MHNKGTRWLMVSSAATTMGMGMVLMMSTLVPSWGPTPATQMIEGAIVAIQPQVGGPNLRIGTAGDEVMEVAVDSNETVVLLDGRPAGTEELARGRRVKVYYTTTHGKRTATSVVVRTPTVRFPDRPTQDPAHAATPAK